MNLGQFSLLPIELVRRIVCFYSENIVKCREINKDFLGLIDTLKLEGKLFCRNGREIDVHKYENLHDEVKNNLWLQLREEDKFGQTLGKNENVFLKVNFQIVSRKITINGYEYSRIKKNTVLLILYDNYTWIILDMKKYCFCTYHTFLNYYNLTDKRLKNLRYNLKNLLCGVIEVLNIKFYISWAIECFLISPIKCDSDTVDNIRDISISNLFEYTNGILSHQKEPSIHVLYNDDSCLDMFPGLDVLDESEDGILYYLCKFLGII